MAASTLVFASASSVVACGGGKGANGPLVGSSDRAPGGSGMGDAGADAAFVDGAGSLPPNYRASFTKVNKTRFVSQGHAAGRWEVDVYANDIAKQALATRARDVPVGAVVVEEHYEKTDATKTGPVMVIEKRPPGFSKDHGDWRYAVIGSKGQLVKDGAIEQCAGCHDDAPMDGLFPIVE